MSIWAIVPIKPLNRSKSRLSSVLDIKQRESLSREMLERTLRTLNMVESIKGTMVVSRDSRAVAGPAARRADAAGERRARLNASPTMATQVVMRMNVSGVLLIASTLPLQPEDIENMVAMVTPAGGRHRHGPAGRGTNAMLIKPPGLFPYEFGEGSLEAPCGWGRRVPTCTCTSRQPRPDVDVPADLICTARC